MTGDRLSNGKAIAFLLLIILLYQSILKERFTKANIFESAWDACEETSQFLKTGKNKRKNNADGRQRRSFDDRAVPASPIALQKVIACFVQFDRVAHRKAALCEVGVAAPEASAYLVKEEL